MKKLFIHQPFFRILSPVFGGIMVYLLILLLNNTVDQLQEQFLGEELYVCIGLSYVVQEISRALLLLFKRLPKTKYTFVDLLLQVVISLVINVLIVRAAFLLYYKHITEYTYTPTKEEIVTLCSIFAVITFIYILLYVSHQYLYKINSEKLQHEELIKQNIEDDFRQFKRGINPHLLFESFEAMIVLIHQDNDRADEFIDHLSTIYRYILSSKDRQLVSFREESTHLSELENLFNQLPYRSLKIDNEIKNEFLVVPGSLLFLVELIVRNTIISSEIPLNLVLTEKDESLVLTYKTHDKINADFNTQDLKEIERVYSIYSEQEIAISFVDGHRQIVVPKLTTKS